MDGWMDDGMDAWMHGCMDAWMYACMSISYLCITCLFSIETVQNATIDQTNKRVEHIYIYYTESGDIQIVQL